MVKGNVLMKDELNEIRSMYLRYLHVKGEIKEDFEVYLKNNINLELKGKVDYYLSSGSKYKKLLAKIHDNKQLKKCIEYVGEDKKEVILTIEGVQSVETDLVNKVYEFDGQNSNIGQQLFVIWVILNYKQKELDTNTFKRFITLNAIKLGLPEIYIKYKKPNKSEVKTYNEHLYTERNKYTFNTKKRSLSLVKKVKDTKDYYVLTETGEGYAMVLESMLSDELNKIYEGFK